MTRCSGGSNCKDVKDVKIQVRQKPQKKKHTRPSRAKPVATIGLSKKLPPHWPHLARPGHAFLQHHRMDTLANQGNL